MKIHAESQIPDAEAARLLVAALGDPACRASLRIVDARAFSSQDMLELSTFDTPEGPLHRIAAVRVLDGEPMGLDYLYLDEVDALAVWEHLANEVRQQAATSEAPTA